MADLRTIEAPPLRFNTAAWLATFIVVAVMAGTRHDSVAALIAAVALSVLAAPLAAPLSIVYFAVTITGSYLLAEHPIEAGGFKIYGVDFLAVMLGWAGLHTTVAAVVRDNRNTPGPVEKRLMFWLFLWCAYGLVEVAIGLSRGYPYDDVLGDFRRYCFYMLAFVAALLLPFKPRHLHQLNTAIVCGGLGIAALCVYRIYTGRYPIEQEDFATGYRYARLLPMAEAASLTLLLAFLIAQMFTTRRVARTVGSALLCCGLVPLFILSGYRYAMLLSAAAPALTVLYFLWLHPKSFNKVLVLVALLSAVSVLGTALTFAIFHELVGRTLTDLTVRLQSTQATGEWRYWVWRQTWLEYIDNPITGKGFGHDLIVLIRGSSGDLLNQRASAHNTVLTVLYRTGAIGLLIFTMFHFTFLVHALRNAKSVPPEHQALYASLLVFVVCSMGNSLLQPFEVPQFVLLYLAMGFMLRTIRKSTEGEQRHDAKESVVAG